MAGTFLRINGKRRDSFGGAESQCHDMLAAEKMLAKGMRILKLKPNELLDLKKNNPRKRVIAWYIRQNTSVKNEWIAEKLHIGCVSSISQFLREVENSKTGILHQLRNTLK